jgi:CHAD domain-containing protein
VEHETLHALRIDPSARARQSAHIVLGWAEGKDERALARELATRPQRVQRVVEAFTAKRLEIFSAAARQRILHPTKPKPASPLPVHTAPTTMHAAAQKILAHQFSKLQNVEAAVRAGNDADAVHDMRVASRRIHSALRLFKNFLPRKRVKKLRKVLEELRATLGAARNLDVLCANLDAYRITANVAEPAQLERVLAAWRNERAQLQTALLVLLDSETYLAWQERLSAFVNAPPNDASPRVADVLPALLWKQYGAVRVYETRWRDANAQTLHALRIDLKRLRYTLEFFADEFGGKPNVLLDPLIALQDQLGEIQDAVVAGQALTEFIGAQVKHAEAEGRAVPEFQTVAAYHAYLTQRIAALGAHLPEQLAIIFGAMFRRQLGELAATL